MRDLGTQTAKSNATKTMQAAAVGAGVGVAAGAVISNSSNTATPSSNTTASASPTPARSTTQTASTYQQTPTYQSSSPTVVNNHYENRNSGSGDLLTGVLLGQAISNSGRAAAQPAPTAAPATTTTASPSTTMDSSYSRSSPATVVESSSSSIFGMMIALFVLMALLGLAFAVYNARSPKKALQQTSKGNYTL